MYKMSVFWVSRFGPCCEINLEVESRAQEAAGRAQEPWQFHQLLSGVPWYSTYTPKFPFQVDQFSGRDCKYLAVANGITSGEKLQYMYIQYCTVQPPPHIEWDLVFFVLCMIGCANLCYTCLCARVRVLLRQFVLCVIDTVARKVTRKPCSFAILITRTVIIIKYCSILYSMRFKGYVLNSHFIFQHPEYVCL